MHKEKNFKVLVTGVRDTDSAVYNMVGKEKEIIFFRLPYTAPYSEFKGIRQFQSAKRFRPFESDTSSEKIISIDLSEWCEHAGDEHLEIFMKYLHDLQEDGFEYRFVFTVGNHKKSEITQLLVLMFEYLADGRVYEDKTLMDESYMQKYILDKGGITYKASEILARILVDNQVSYTLLDAILEDILRKKERDQVSEQDIFNDSFMSQTKFGILYRDKIEKLKREKMKKNSEAVEVRR